MPLPLVLDLTASDAELREFGLTPGGYTILSVDRMEEIRLALEDSRGTLPDPSRPVFNKRVTEKIYTSGNCRSKSVFVPCSLEGLPRIARLCAPCHGRVYHFHRKLLFVNINKRVIRVTTTIARKAPRKGRGEHSIEEKRNKVW